MEDDKPETAATEPATAEPATAETTTTESEKETAATEPTTAETTTTEEATKEVEAEAKADAGETGETDAAETEATEATEETEEKEVDTGETKRDTKHYKYLLTINNPQDHDLTHDIIKHKLERFNYLYYCLSDEEGKKGHTLHTHLFIMFKNLIRFSTIKKLFPKANIRAAYGSAEENRAYVEKSGKWENDEKADTSIPGTFEESGPVPEEPGQGFRSDIVEIFEKIEAGMSSAQIMKENPNTALHIGKMEKIRQELLEEEYGEVFRQLDTTYIWGPTETGKTRFVMDTYGYRNVCRVTDYTHPFDTYRRQPVLSFEEFRSSLKIADMLKYLEGYPIALPARYTPRQACYNKVYIISNIPLVKQYPSEQAKEPETWKAFLRRIHHVIEYQKDGSTIDHGNATDYIASLPPPVFPSPDNSIAFNNMKSLKAPTSLKPLPRMGSINI